MVKATCASNLKEYFRQDIVGELDKGSTIDGADELVEVVGDMGGHCDITVVYRRTHATGLVNCIVNGLGGFTLMIKYAHNLIMFFAELNQCHA